MTRFFSQKFFGLSVFSAVSFLTLFVISAPESQSSLPSGIQTEIVSGPPYYGYTTFKNISALPIEELSSYINFLHVQHRTRYENGSFIHFKPTAQDLQRLGGTNIKLILKLDQYLVEPISLEECAAHYGIPADGPNVCGFNESELRELATIIEPYRDVILAIYPINEPYKPENRYSEEYLREVVQQVRDIFPGYAIYNNFLSPYWSGLGEEFPNIPENIDIIAFDAYHTPGPDQETWYKDMIGSDIAIIKDRAGGRPVIFSSLAFRIDREPPEGPDSRPELYQAQWDYELYVQHGLAGLRWFFYEEKAETWYGASYWPDLIAKHKEIGRNIFGLSPTPATELSPVAFLPLVLNHPRPAPPGGVTIIRDILYGDSANGERNLLDLYLPDSSAEEVPVIVWIHGGGLTTGNKGMAGQGMPLVQEGFALVGVNYRLTSQGDYLPVQIYDVKAAVRWVRANADTYNLDPNRIGVIGGSAGAMLAASLGTSGDVEELEGTVGPNLAYSSRVQAVVPMAGIYDFTNFFAGEIWRYENDPNATCAETQIQYFFGCCLADGTGQCRHNLDIASAITFVSPDDPPFLVTIGSEDETPHGLEDHTAFHNALVEQGVDSTLLIVPGAHHGESFAIAFNEILDFLNRHLKQ